MSNKTPIYHFNDYGFDHQINYFQEEPRKHKRESISTTIDLHYKLQKPNNKDNFSKKIKKRWWSNTFLFFKSSRKRELVTHRVTESRTVSWTPYRTARKPGSCPLKKGDVEIPYISLKELNMEQHCKPAIPIYLVT